MDKFEYKIMKISDCMYYTGSLELGLKKLGDEGWELVNIEEYRTDLAYFKRKKEKILCDTTEKIVSTNLEAHGSYYNQCEDLISKGYELIDVKRNSNGDYYAHLCKYEYK